LNLIKYFKSSFPGQYITIAVVGLIIWVLPVINPPQMPAPEGPVPLYILLYNWLSGMPYLAMAAGFLLVLFEAIWLNYLSTRHDLVQHNTSMASFMFILFVSILPAYLTLTPANITILLLILTLRSLFGAYNQVEANEQVFTAGFFVALASFFYLPSLLLYGFLVVCFIIFRTPDMAGMDQLPDRTDHTISLPGGDLFPDRQPAGDHSRLYRLHLPGTGHFRGSIRFRLADDCLYRPGHDDGFVGFSGVDYITGQI